MTEKVGLEQGTMLGRHEGEASASPARQSAKVRNLAQRPAAPARLAGYVQRMARRALIVLETASTSQVLEWTRCRGPVRHHDYRAARRALEQIGADRIGRSSGRGRAWLWKLRE
jgi:hypothetical protein